MSSVKKSPSFAFVLAMCSPNSLPALIFYLKNLGESCFSQPKPILHVVTFVINFSEDFDLVIPLMSSVWKSILVGRAYHLSSP